MKKHKTFPDEQPEMPVKPEVPEIQQPADPREPEIPEEDKDNIPEEMPPLKEHPDKDIST